MKNALLTLKALPLFLIGLLSLSAAVLMEQDNLKLPIAEKFDSWNRRHPEERVYLQFDKTLYEPGETVWFAGFVRHAQDLTTDSISDILHVEVINPKGAVERHMKYIINAGIANGDFTFTNEMAGGIYKFRAYTMYSLNDSTIKLFEKEITLQKSVLANLLMKLDFKEKGYTPGQTATAKLEIKTPDGRPLTDHEFTYEVLTQGNKTFEGKGKTDVAGSATVSYAIPADLQTADLLLNVRLTYNNNTESVSRSVPVNLKTVQIEFYPEGGDLVAGLNSRVAFSAVDDFGKPANVEGAVYNDLKQPVAIIQCLHHGMGSFQLTPQSGRTYYAQLNTYGDRKFPLPETKNMGVALAVSQADKENLTVKVLSTEARPLIVITQMRGRIYDYQNLDGISANSVSIPLKALPTGVAQVTVFDRESKPLAERLVFVNKNKQLRLQITTSKEKYQPHEKVKMTVKARDENNKIVSGDVCIAVVDEKVLTLANDKSGAILSRLLLEADITGNVEEPNFYFDEKEPQADAALDLLMMTRGWRRFVWNKVLSNDSTVYANKAERKFIGGEVVNFKTGKPARYSNVTVLGTDIGTSTDKNGHFELFGVDLSQVQVLAVKKFNKELYYNVNEYGTGHKLDFEAGRTYYSNRNDYRYNRGGGGGYRDDNGVDVRYGNYRENHKPTKKAEIIYKAGTGNFTGTILDENNEPVFAGNIVEINNGAATGVGGVTDFDGHFQISKLNPGKHHFRITYIGYESQELEIEVTPTRDISATIFLNEMAIELNEVVVATSYRKAIQYETVSMEVISARNMATENAISRVPGVTYDAQSNVPAAKEGTINRGNGLEKETGSNTVGLNEVRIVSYKVPLFNSYVPSTNAVTTEQIANMPTRSVTDIISTVSGVFQRDEGESVNIRGGRDNATAYYIDGVKVMGVPNIPTESIERIRVYTGGIPARYGDVTCGVVEIETKKMQPITYYTYPGVLVSVLNEGIMARYSSSREFPKLIHKGPDLKGGTFDNRTTIFWSGAVHLDDFGKADFEFISNDEISNFRITAEGISDEGLVGHAEKTFSNCQALVITAKFPKEAVNGDILEIPVVISNNTTADVNAQLTFTLPAGWWPLGELPKDKLIPANGIITVPLKIKAGKGDGKSTFTIEAKTEKYNQRLVRDVLLKKAGYTQYAMQSSSAYTQKLSMSLPDVLDSTFKAQFIVYPSGTSSLVDAVKGLIQEPHGCFEQVSSSTYPNILAIKMLQQMKSADSKLQEWATKCIGDGYTALSNYEVPGGGFDLYGKAPANVPMTAYGLMEFTEMKKVYPKVSDELIERTRQFLLAQKNGTGFNLGTKDTYYPGAKRQIIANAYICWALSEAGVSDIKEVVNALLKDVSRKDPYQMALLANTCHNLGMATEAAQLNAALSKLQSADGRWAGSEGTIVGSYGSNVDVEASALVLISLLHEYDKYSNEITLGVRYLLASRTYGGRFGNTQATILALRALTESHQKNGEVLTPGHSSLTINGSAISLDSLDIQPNYSSVIDGLERLLNAGNNNLQLTFPQTTAAGSFNVSCSWQNYLPQSHPACKLEMQTTLNKTEAAIGETVRMDISIKNKIATNVPTPMVVINIPSGLSVQNWQLKELQEKKVFDYYETDGNELRLYFYGLNANEQRKIALDLKTEVKGEYKAAASSAYLYYDNEARQWVDGTHIIIH